WKGHYRNRLGARHGNASRGQAHGCGKHIHGRSVESTLSVQWPCSVRDVGCNHNAAWSLLTKNAPQEAPSARSVMALPQEARHRCLTWPHGFELCPMASMRADARRIAQQG